MLDRLILSVGALVASLALPGAAGASPATIAPTRTLAVGDVA
jgi:hypothetical protein